MRSYPQLWGFITTTDCSVPASRFGILIFSVLPLGFPPLHRDASTQFTYQNLCHVDATLMPVNVWTESSYASLQGWPLSWFFMRFTPKWDLPDSSPYNNKTTVLMTSMRFGQFVKGTLLFVSMALTWLHRVNLLHVKLTTIPLEGKRLTVVWNLHLL